jgi:predicted small secreted protein
VGLPEFPYAGSVYRRSARATTLACALPWIGHRPKQCRSDYSGKPEKEMVMYLRFVAIAAAAALIAGCNTMRGAGEDIKAGEHKIENAFSKNKKPADDTSNTNSNVNTPTTPNPATSGADADSTRTVPDTSMSTPPSGTSTQ